MVNQHNAALIIAKKCNNFLKFSNFIGFEQTFYMLDCFNTWTKQKTKTKGMKELRMANKYKFLQFSTFNFQWFSEHKMFDCFNN